MTIYQKLQVVKATIGTIKKDKTNSFFKNKYTDINSILGQLEPLLEEQGLLLLQPIEDGMVCTKIIDVETEKIVCSCMELPRCEDPQKLLASITYFRRGSLVSLLSLEAEDDDGNIASGKTEVVKTPPSTTKGISVWLTEDQFNKTINGTPKQIKTVLSLYDGKNGKSMKKEYREQLNSKL